MQTTTADKWDRVRAAWLWTECGDGNLLPVRDIDADWWIRTGVGMGGASWCCHAGTTLYVGTPEEAKGQERVLQDDLRERRRRWNEPVGDHGCASLAACRKPSSELPERFN